MGVSPPLDRFRAGEESQVQERDGKGIGHWFEEKWVVVFLGWFEKEWCNQGTGLEYHNGVGGQWE